MLSGVPEVLAPAGSKEALIAAVQSGADALYLGGPQHNARRYAQNFHDDELQRAVDYCHVRNVKVYLTLNTLFSDIELQKVLAYIEFINEIGIDAVIVQDLGLVRLISSVAPDLKIHASTQMTIHNSEGVWEASRMGVSRIILAREVSRNDLNAIMHDINASHAEMKPEIEVFVHGAMCMSYSGQCFMSSSLGERSGNRGSCAQPCRLPYELGRKATSHRLSLKDMCLGKWVYELSKMGISSLKIEGRMKRPEYVAAATAAYREAVDGKAFNVDVADKLEKIFSRSGFSDGYYTGIKGACMFGIRESEKVRDLELILANERKQYENTENKLIKLKFSGVFRVGKRMQLTVSDYEGNSVQAEGDICQKAAGKGTQQKEIVTRLKKCGGTPYRMAISVIDTDGKVFIPVSDINQLRRNALDKMTKMRSGHLKRRFIKPQPFPSCKNSLDPPDVDASFYSITQIDIDIVKRRLNRIWLPLEEIVNNEKAVKRFLCEGLKLGVVTPRVVAEKEKLDFEGKLERIKALGVINATVGNLGVLSALTKAGFSLYGDYGLNVFNSTSLRAVRRLGMKSALLSFELSFAQVRDINKTLDCGLIVYGRLPMMLTENCIVTSSGGVCGSCKNTTFLQDRMGISLPILKEYGCRSVLYNAHKLYLADKKNDWSRLGLSFVQMNFTTENIIECRSVIDAYTGGTGLDMALMTRGNYYRGVD